MPLIPIILELDEELSEQEEMIGVQTIAVNVEGNHLVGYVAMIKDFSGINKIRYGNLKVKQYKGKKLNNFVL